jgi:ABC-type nitrate/sulfonate/bicarbonate transport system substrate-binding protein
VFFTKKKHQRLTVPKEGTMKIKVVTLVSILVFVISSIALADAIEVDFSASNTMVPTEKFEPIAPQAEMNLGIFEVWDLQLPRPADELGYFKDVNIKIKGAKDFNKETTMMEALQEGSLDSAGTAAIVSVPLFKTLNKIIWGPPYDMWWGNAVMARPGDFKTYDEILEEVGDEEKAARLACAQLKGRTWNAMLGAGHDNFINALLERGGLTREDVKFNDLPHTENAAAFIRGEGDIYLGDLPGRYRVAEAGAVPIIDASLFGQEAWCFVGYLFNKDWLDQNEETAIRFIGALYRVADVLSGPDKDKALEIMRHHVNRTTGASFTMEEAHIVNSQISPWLPAEEAKDTFFNSGSKFNWKDRLQYMIDWNITQGKLKEGEVTVASHSRADELFEKYWNYKSQAEADMKAAADAFNAGTAQNKEKVKGLIEQAKWNWDIRNYIDAAKLAADAKAATGA